MKSKLTKMDIKIRKAEPCDIDGCEAVYNKILDSEERGESTVGWKRGIYPTRETALGALSRGELFVGEYDGRIVGCAIFNKTQVDVYEGAPWRYDADADEVMVMHTLVVSPDSGKRGIGRAFEEFYEKYALENGCRFLRIDTNKRNANARAFYKKLGYEEISVVPCKFNGLDDVRLVLLEKRL